MKVDAIIGNFFNIIVMAIVLETAISALFSITAVKEQERKIVVKTMREAITFLAAIAICFSINELRTFAGSGLKIQAKVDMIITALLLARMSGIVRDLVNRLRGE